MSLKYDLKKLKSSLPNGDYKYYAQIAKQGDVYLSQIVDEITTRSAASAGDVIGIFRLLIDVTAQHLAEGERVHLDDLGSFMARITSEPIDDPSEIRQLKTKSKPIQFTPAKYFSDQIKWAHMERSWEAHRFNNSTKASLDTLRSLLQKALDKDGYITRPQYGHLAGRLRYKAQQDLTAFVNEGWLERCGSGAHVFYRRKKEG